ncbi:hypothetical protein BKA69DRAFT_1173089 [Paraphysoderma sedebokerense]|nr:hypothetical protein BKA69DRAFT_1173089 [Paraphysoderma sedebokerense]
MFLLQRFTFILAILQFGSTVVIPSSHVLTRPSTSNIRSPVVPAVRPTLNRRPTVATKAGLGENIFDVAHFAFNAMLVTGTVACIQSMAKQCMKTIFAGQIWPKPTDSLDTWMPEPISFPIDFSDTEDWQFVGFHGTINKFVDQERNTVMINNQGSMETNRLGTGFYVTDSIMDARYKAETDRRECLRENEGSDQTVEEADELLSGRRCDYAMCAAFISKRYWSNADKVIVSRTTSGFWEGEAIDHLNRYQNNGPRRPVIAISHMYRKGRTMEMKFVPEHSQHMLIVCGEDDVAERVLGNDWDSFLSKSKKNLAKSNGFESGMGVGFQDRYWSNQKNIERRGSFAKLFSPSFYLDMLDFSIESNIKKGQSGGSGPWKINSVGHTNWLDEA